MLSDNQTLEINMLSRNAWVSLTAFFTLRRILQRADLDSNLDRPRLEPRTDQDSNLEPT